MAPDEPSPRPTRPPSSVSSRQQLPSKSGPSIAKKPATVVVGSSSPRTRTGGNQSSLHPTNAPSPSLSPPDLDASQATGTKSRLLPTVLAVAAVCLLVLALVAWRIYVASKRKNKDGSGDSPVFVEMPGTPGNTGDDSDPAPEGDQPMVGYLPNDVRNDPALAAFRIIPQAVKLGQTIAKGGFGVIYRGVYDSRDVAIKRTLPKAWRDNAELARFMDEIRLCATLQHPKIVAFVGITWTSLRDLSVVIEFMPGGDLHQTLRKQPGPSRADWDSPWTASQLKNKTAIASDVAEAVVYLHSFDAPILHRDLKARNVLLDERGNAKLSDFGISREVAVDETMTSEVGTVAWIAPEVLRGERYSEKADIYSFGVLLVELDRCRHPYADFDGENGATSSGDNAFKNANLILQVSSGQMRPETSSECPEAIASLIQQCLSFEASDRPSASEISNILSRVSQQK